MRGSCSSPNRSVRQCAYADLGYIQPRDNRLTCGDTGSRRPCGWCSSTPMRVASRAGWRVCSCFCRSHRSTRVRSTSFWTGRCALLLRCDHLVAATSSPSLPTGRRTRRIAASVSWRILAMRSLTMRSAFLTGDRADLCLKRGHRPDNTAGLSGSSGCCTAGSEERAARQAFGSGGHACGCAIQALHLLAEGGAVQPRAQGYQVTFLIDRFCALSCITHRRGLGPKFLRWACSAMCKVGASEQQFVRHVHGNA